MGQAVRLSALDLHSPSAKAFVVETPEVLSGALLDHFVREVSHTRCVHCTRAPEICFDAVE
jgi:hypothetical protein